MKILKISLDRNSKLAKRILEHGNLVDGLAVIVPHKDHKEVKLSEKVFVYGSGGSDKIFQLISVHRLARKILKRNKFDVITVQDQYYLGLIGWLLARKFKIGLELQIHGFEKYSGLRKMLAKFVIPKADAIRCVSQRLKKQLINDFRVKEEKITVVPIYSELRTDNFKLKTKKEGDKFVFLTVSRLVAVKNIGLQIRAMAEVVKKYPNVELWIIGDGPERKKLELKIKKLKLQNYIKLFGWQNSLDKFYSQADVFLLTSNSEGWGMAVVEAISCGVTIIMTDVGCAGELIENEKSGLVVPVNNQVKLEEAMIRIICDENLRKKLTEGAILAVKKLPSKEETLALYKQSWEKAIKNK